MRKPEATDARLTQLILPIRELGVEHAAVALSLLEPSAAAARTTAVTIVVAAFPEGFSVAHFKVRAFVKCSIRGDRPATGEIQG